MSQATESRQATPPGPLLAADQLRSLPGLVLLDCRAGPRRGGYDISHIVGARRAELETDLSAPADPAHGGRHPLPTAEAWCATLGRWGITAGTPVAVYDDRGGGLYAARAWWMLRAIGHRTAYVVDGGYTAALAAGAPTDDATPTITAAPGYPSAGWSWPMATAQEVELRRTDPDWRIIDARASERWRGEVEPIDPIAGKIPGSRNLPWETTVTSDGRLHPPARLRAQLAPLLGTTPSQRVIVHCGSGVTACHTLLALEVAGYDHAALYIGSYSEWCAQGRDLR